MNAAATIGGQRMALDELVGRLLEPGFAARFSRVPALAASSGHVSLQELQMAPPRSRFVRRWRRHARRCPSCAAVFRRLGMPLE